jgi:hypothetical protein
MNRIKFGLLAVAGLLLFAGAASAQPLSEDFVVAPPVGWQAINNSIPVGPTTVFQGNSTVFPAQSGAPTSYAGMNFNATTGANTISVWLITPSRVGIQNGDTWSFWTRTVTTPAFPDRLEFRLSTNGATCSPGTGPTSVGDFGTLLTTINPTLTLAGYPNVWTQFQGTLSGIAAPSTGCFAFRYFVTNGGPGGANSDYIGVDTFVYSPVPVELQTFTIE